MIIDLLKNHPQHIPTLAAWLKAESPDYFREQSLDQIAREHFASRLNEDVLPMSLVALEGDSAIGTIALLTESISTHRQLGPWIGALHVHESFRHRGVGMELVQAAVTKAASLGYACVYAGISAAREQYLGRGWEVVEEVQYHGADLAIIRLALGNEN